MRQRIVVFTAFLFGLIAWLSGTAHAHYGALSYYPGATPKALCYKLVGDMASDRLWLAWIENAANGWNQANAGWTFKPCDSDDEKAQPDIVFTFGDASKAGGSGGGKQGGGADLGYWRIVVQKDVNGIDVNGTTVNGEGAQGGWSLDNKPGQTNLDPVLVLEHELGHALGLDHSPADGCNTGNLEEPICAGNHNNPKGRRPSVNDVAEVQKGIAAAKAKTETPPPPPPEHSMAPPAPAPGSWYYCDASGIYYPYAATCAVPWRTVPAQPASVTDTATPAQAPVSVTPGTPSVAIGVVPVLPFGLGIGVGTGRENTGTRYDRDGRSDTKQKK